MNDIPFIEEINIKNTPKCSINYYWLKIITDGFGKPIHIPVMVARGTQISPVLGITAAVHGNELNGIPVIQRLFNEIDVNTLRGVIIAIPVVNIPSYIRKKRRFVDGVDLNHIMPGKANGNVSQVYAYRFIERVISKFDYLLDLHTASHGRVNSYYIRADLSETRTNDLANLQNAQIIVHNPPKDGTLRGAAADMGIPAITLEVGNPSTFQKKMIKSGVEGIHNVLGYLKMTDDELIKTKEQTIICDKSYWIFTDTGGLLTVHVELCQMLQKGDLIATLRGVFGNMIKQYFAPENGIVIGKSVSPVNQTGGRIIHLGINIRQS